MAHAGQQAHHDLLRRQRQTGGDLGGALAGVAESIVGGVSSEAAATRDTAGGQTSAAQGTSAPVQQTTTSAAAPPTQQTSAAPPPSSSTTLQEVTHSTTTSAAPVPSSTTTEPVQQSTTTTTAASSTTTQAADTSSTSATTSSTTTTTAASSSSVLSLSSASAFTTVVVVPASSSTLSSSASAATVSRPASNAAQSGTGVSTGAVVGIVVGALAGVAVLACAVVWLFKKKFTRDDDDQVSPFDRDEFRRASVMLDDVDEHYGSQSLNSYRNVTTNGGGPGSINGGHSPQMSEYSMHDMMANGALARSGTLMSSTGTAAALPGLARGNTLNAPRPPTMIQHHYQHQQAQQQQQGMMPSFQPGQVVPGMPSPPPPSYHTGYGGSGAIDLYGATGGAGPYGAIPHPAGMGGLAPYPVAAGGLDRSLSTASAGPWHGSRAGPGADLSRNNSQASAYSQMSDGAQAGSFLPAALRPGGSSHGHGGPGTSAYDERPLSLVHEDDEPYSPSNPTFDRARQAGAELSRSGTPVNHNVQQTFFSHSAAGHVREESLDAFGARKGSADRGVEQSGVVGRWSDGEEFADDGASVKRERRLSVRNGGLDQFDEDDAGVYGGMH